MNPVLKRFLKGLIATAFAAVMTRELGYMVTFLATNPTTFGTATAIITGLLLAVEKAFPNNF